MRDISNKSFRLHAEISLSADLQKQQKFYYMDKADDKKYEESIIKWILDSYQPLSDVEIDSFHKMVNCWDQSFSYRIQ